MKIRQKIIYKNTLIILVLLLVSGLSGCTGKDAVTVWGMRTEEENSSTEPETGKDYFGTKQHETEGSELVVYVCGAVAQPGVYHLPQQSRVYEAIEAAGGFSQDADREWLNLADLLQDGMMLKICTVQETDRMKAQGLTAGCTEGGTSGQEEQGNSLIDLNSASREELMTLPGIGQTRAEAVIAYREEHGPFRTIEGIMDVSGIKEAVFLKIKDRITV